MAASELSRSADSAGSAPREVAIHGDGPRACRRLSVTRRTPMRHGSAEDDEEIRVERSSSARYAHP